MKQTIILLSFTLFSITAFTQDANFTISLSTDSVLMGNYFQVKFTLENASGKNFSAPSFEHFNIVGGPNQSMMTSVVNGEMTQSLSYSFYLEPKDLGNFFIEPASIEANGTLLETQPVELLVFANPDGVKQDPNIREGSQSPSFDFFQKKEKPAPKKKPKKKRKIYKM